MTTVNKLWWFQIHDTNVCADSYVWRDQGVPLRYTVRYDFGVYNWIATFEGAELASGNLTDCLEACQKHEESEP